MAPNQHYLRSMVSMVNTQSMTTPKRCCCWWWWWWWCFPFGLGNPNLTNPQILRCLYPDVPPFKLPVSRYSTDFQVSSICDINWTCIPRKAWSCACRCIFRSFLGTPNPTMGGHWSFFLLSWPRSTLDHNKDFQTLPTVLDDWWFCESQDMTKSIWCTEVPRPILRNIAKNRLNRCVPGPARAMQWAFQL